MINFEVKKYKSDRYYIRYNGICYIETMSKILQISEHELLKIYY